MQSYPEELLYYLLLLYLFSFAIPWKLAGKKLHACQLQSRRKEKPLPLWAVIISQDGWLPTLLRENPWLLQCSYAGNWTAEQTALIPAGKTGWSSPFFSKLLRFCVSLPASSGGSNSSLWHVVQKQLWWSTQGGTKHCSPLCFQTCVFAASAWVQPCPVLANLKNWWPQDVPKQSTKKEKKPWLFFSTAYLGVFT